MRVLVTGATGFIGASVVPSLLSAGHTVVGAVRSSGSAEAVRAAGGEAVVVDFADGGRIASALRDADAVIHLAADEQDPEGFDRRVAEAAVDALGGTGTPYVHTGGVWLYGSGDAIQETDPYDPPRLTAWRGGVIEGLAEADLAFTVVHPGIVYGHGRGIAQLLAGQPRTDDGRLTTLGSGEQHWTTIHVEDLGALYTAVVAAGSGFGDVLAVGGGNPRVLDLTAAFAGADGVATEAPDATRARLGDAFAEALLLDQQAAGEKARGIGDWRPSWPSLLDEVRAR